MKPYPKTVVCVIWIGNKILLCQRKLGVFAGKWQATGGKVEEGEDLARAAVREAIEESGIGIDSNFVRIVDCVTNDPTTDKCFIFHVKLMFWAKWFVRNTEPDKHGPWQLFTVEEALQLPLLPGLTEYFKTFKK